jgi:membrane-associated protease RseP (regulator of RpoE activity)
VTNFPAQRSLADEEASARRPARPVPVRRQMLNLALIVLAVTVPFLVTGRETMLLMIGCLGFFIMFHEFGHFAIAKLSGMKVTEFFIGFGPRLFSIRKGETEYGIKAFPLGGYVKIIGMASTDEVDPDDELRTYRRQRWYKRVATILAGPMTHFVMAFALLTVIFGFTGIPQLPNTIGEVIAGSPAARAQLAVGDRITAVGTTQTETWDAVVTQLGVADEPVALTIENRAGVVRTLDLRREMREVQGVRRPLIGVGFGNQQPVRRTYALGTSAKMAGSELKRLTGATFGGIGKFFQFDTIKSFAQQVGGAASAEGPITDAELQNRPTSIVGMTQIGAEVAKIGATELLELLVLINLALGTFNLLPMLPLDGGHIVVATYESVMGKFTGRRHYLNMNRIMPIVGVFFGLLLLMGLGAIYLDIVRPIA